MKRDQKLEFSSKFVVRMAKIWIGRFGKNVMHKACSCKIKSESVEIELGYFFKILEISQVRIRLAHVTAPRLV